MQTPLLTILTLLPLVGALVVALLRRDDAALLKGATLASSLVTLAVSLALWPAFDSLSGELQLRHYIPWLSEWGIGWNAAVDGLSLLLILLTTVLTPLMVLGAWHAIERDWKLFGISVLVLEAAVIGAFTQVNLFFFFVFWELMLMPMLLIIGVWGSGNRIKSAVKFFLYTAVGSLLMLVAILVLAKEAVAQLGYMSFNLEALLQLRLPPERQFWLFGAFALAFAIKVPLFPLHTWLPDAHVDAPTPGSVVLAGVLLKLGTYGLMRFAMPLFPEATAAWAPVMLALAAAGVVFGALVAWVQTDMKKLIAYSSVSHMGIVVLGIFAGDVQAGVGAVVQMVGHGISTGALFLLVGMIYERRHTRDLDAYGGIAAIMPKFAAVFLIATMASVGLPGLNGFVGEFLVLLGSFRAGMAHYTAGVSSTLLTATVISATGVVLGAVYMLTLYLKVFFGPVRHAGNRGLKDLSVREWVVILPLVAAMFIFGVFPQPLITRIEPAVKVLYERRVRTLDPAPARWSGRPVAQLDLPSNGGTLR